MRRLKSLATLILIVLSLVLSPAGSSASPDAVETGRLLAILLDSGRVTVGANQSLINDPDRGTKGFTPEVFEKQMSAMFRERTGIDLTDLNNTNVPEMAKPLLARLVEESKKTIESYQAAINIQGIRYKGLIPATFGTEAAARFTRWSGIYLKQTAPDRLLRNPKNKADEFEAGFFEHFSDQSYTRKGETVISETLGDGKTVRVMLPLFYRKQCLGCHGEPKGERDITGGLKEGGRENELAGALSVKIDLK